jgi:hypothetical protein
MTIIYAKRKSAWGQPGLGRIALVTAFENELSFKDGAGFCDDNSKQGKSKEDTTRRASTGIAAYGRAGGEVELSKAWARWGAACCAPTGWLFVGRGGIGNTWILGV